MSAKLQDYKVSLERALNDKTKPWSKYLDAAEQRTGVNRLYLFAGTLVFYFTFIYIFSSSFDVLFCVVQVQWRSLVYI